MQNFDYFSAGSVNTWDDDDTAIYIADLREKHTASLDEDDNGGLTLDLAAFYGFDSVDV